MTDPDSEFRLRLLATFKEEADEHLTDITQDLLALEKADPASAASPIERAYRKTHSLKGAARAVKYREIESLCQNLESVFSAMKKGEFTPDAEAFDLFHEAVKVTRMLLVDEDAARTAAGEIRHRIRLITDTMMPAPGPIPPGPPGERPPLIRLRATRRHRPVNCRMYKAVVQPFPLRFIPPPVKPGIRSRRGSPRGARPRTGPRRRLPRGIPGPSGLPRINWTGSLPVRMIFSPPGFSLPTACRSLRR